MLSLRNIFEHAWMNLNKHDSEYAYDPKYAKILNMIGLWICEYYTAFWICQIMPWQSCEYILGLSMSGF